MAAISQDMRIRTGSTGRSFVSMDPERQREVSVDVIRIAEPSTPVRPGRPARTDWVRVLPDRDTSTYEGSSSRRSR